MFSWPPAPGFFQAEAQPDRRPIALEVPFAATQLRKALQLPTSQAQYSFNTAASSVVGTTWRWDFDPQPDAKAEVARLAKTLKNTDEDADVWLRIGYFRGKDDDIKGADEAYRKADEAFRAQLARRPQDGAAMRGLGIALENLKQPEEAEKALRGAVKLAPNDPRVLVSLSKFLTSQILDSLYSDLSRAIILSRGVTEVPGKDGVAPDTLDAVVGRLLARIQPATLQITETRLQEAKTLSDLAIALAPRDASLYQERAAGAFARRSISQGLATLEVAARRLNTQTSPEARQATLIEVLPRAAQDLFAGLANAESRDDLERAATLSPPEAAASLLVMTVFMDVTRSAIEQDPKAAQQDEIRARANRNLDQVEALAKTTQPPSARVWSLLALGRMASVLLQEDRENGETAKVGRQLTETAARKALALDPKQSTAWDALMITVGHSDEGLPQLQQLAEQRLALDPSASNQFILARALARQNKDGEALRQTVIALALYPNDWPLQLLRATLLLRQPDDASLQAAGVLMEKMGKLPEAAGQDAQLFSDLNGVALARSHRFYEAELVFAASEANVDAPSSLYYPFIASLYEFADTLATAKRHKDVLDVSRILANSSVKMPKEYYIDTLKLTSEEFEALKK